VNELRYWIKNNKYSTGLIKAKILENKEKFRYFINQAVKHNPISKIEIIKKGKYALICCILIHFLSIFDSNCKGHYFKQVPL
jgi:hypothetical protein